MKNARAIVGRVVAGGLLSPRGWLWRAGAVTAAFLVMHWLGWREYTTVLCGTAPVGSGDATWPCGMAVFYLAAYFGFVVIVPILVIGAGVLAVFLRIAERDGQQIPVNQQRIPGSEA